MKKFKFSVFDFVNYLVFIVLALFILIPIWKVLVDSFNAVGMYQFQLLPNRPPLMVIVPSLRQRRFIVLC